MKEDYTVWDVKEEMRPTKMAIFDILRPCQAKCLFCVVPGTKIQLADGVGEKSIKDLKVGDIILGYNEKTNKNENTKIKEVITHKTQDQKYEIEVEEQKKKLKVTYNHPVFTRRGWVAVEDLKEGDEIWLSSASERISNRMKKDNPMFNEEVKKKSVANTNYKEIGIKSSKRLLEMYKSGEFIHISKLNPKKWKEICKKTSERMKTNNPMSNKYIAKKVGEKIRVKSALRKFLGIPKKEITEKQRKKYSDSKKGDKNPNWMGGISKDFNHDPHYRGESWDKIRKEVYKRDNHTCQICGKDKCMVFAHHKVPYRITQDNSMDNLVTVCKSCHTKEESKLYKIYGKGNILMGDK